MSKVNGENVVVWAFIAGVWIPYACATGSTLTLDSDMLETSEVGSGEWATFKPARNSFSGSLTGITSLALTNTLALSDIRALQIAGTPLLLRQTRTDDNGNVYTDEGNFYIKSSQDTGGMGQMNTFSIDLQGTGPLTPIFVPTPIITGGIVHIFEYTATGGETFFSDSSLIGKNIVGAFKYSNYAVITSGTPVGLENKYTSASGRFDWPIAFEPGEYILIQYQDM